MSRSVKLALFMVALLSMACLASASVAMAEKLWWLGACLFVLGLLFVNVGFVVRRKLVTRNLSTPKPQEE